MSNDQPSLAITIFGAGPAGLATAIHLAQADFSVTLITQSVTQPDQARPPIGESLSPSANPLLVELGLWQTFLADGHRPCYGNKSSWGSATLQHYDFINDPNGHGWHIDRPRFEERLRQLACECGVQLEEFTATIPPAAFWVDATGRSSWLARQMGAQRLYEDRHVALAAFLSAKEPQLNDSTSLLEAAEDGWWYSALLPDGRLALLLMTEPGLFDPDATRSPTTWWSLVNQAQHTRHRVCQHGGDLEDAPRWVAADSGRLDHFVGTNWLAVGDAAIRYDPLSAHGLTLALAGGRDAAAAICAVLEDGDNRALEIYSQRLTLAFAHYSTQRRAYYAAERRWPQSRYWQSRLHSKSLPT